MMNEQETRRGCHADDQGYHCTLFKGHLGPHEAWGRFTMHHTWRDDIRARLDELIPHTMIWPPRQWDCTETGPDGDRTAALDYFEALVRKVTA